MEYCTYCGQPMNGFDYGFGFNNQCSKCHEEEIQRRVQLNKHTTSDNTNKINLPIKHIRMIKRIILVLYILIMLTPSAILVIIFTISWMFGINIDTIGDETLDLIADNRLTQYLIKK